LAILCSHYFSKESPFPFRIDPDGHTDFIPSQNKNGIRQIILKNDIGNYGAVIDVQLNAIGTEIGQHSILLMRHLALGDETSELRNSEANKCDFLDLDGVGVLEMREVSGVGCAFVMKIEPYFAGAGDDNRCSHI